MRSACSLRVVTANSRVGNDRFRGEFLFIKFANAFFMIKYVSLSIANDFDLFIASSTQEFQRNRDSNKNSVIARK